MRWTTNAIDEAGQSGVAVDDLHTALKILVRNATEEFGFAPRDVYEGVFRLTITKYRHDTHVANLDYRKLTTLIQTFIDDRALSDFSHHVVAVYPDPLEVALGLDRWVIDFKSIRIRRKVMELMRLAEDQHLRNTFNLLHNIPEGSIMAGWFFEAIVHRFLSNGWRSHQPVPQPIRMVSDDLDPPTFSTNPSTPNASPPYLAPVRDHKSTRAVTRVNFTSGLNDVTLDSNKYYIPTASNNPLFDSFAINFDRLTVVISVFQITTSPKHEGSAQGYLLIRKVMAHVRKLLKKMNGNFKVEVVYFLVFPEDGTPHQWKMPVNWSKNTKINDHRGDTFCIPIPVSV